MIYLISGASRSGKTIIAKKMATQAGIPYLSIDWIMMGFTNGIPAYGVHDKLMPDEIARRLWSFLKAMMESMLFVEDDCIIEGEALLPELIANFMAEHPNQIKACFIGYTEVDTQNKVKEIKAYSKGSSDWLHDKSDYYIIDHVKNMIAYSRLIERSCQENTMQYFDISQHFDQVCEEIVKYLLEGS